MPFVPTSYPETFIAKKSVRNNSPPNLALIANCEHTPPILQNKPVLGRAGPIPN
jgi:hypothetical protein